MDVGARLGRLRGAMAGAEPPDGLLVTSLTNIRYLTGFTGRPACCSCCPTRRCWSPTAATATQADGAAGRGRRRRRASRWPGRPDQAGPAPGAWSPRPASDAWAWRPPTSAGPASGRWPADWFPDVELVPTVGLVEGLRRVKDPGELARLAEAARIADDALAIVRPQLASGLTEEAFGRRLDFEMRRLGASGPSFETIVASGPNAAKPHHRRGRA